MTSSNLHQVPRAPPPKAISVGVSASTYEFEGCMNIQPITAGLRTGTSTCVLPCAPGYVHLSIRTRAVVPFAYLNLLNCTGTTYYFLNYKIRREDSLFSPGNFYRSIRARCPVVQGRRPGLWGPDWAYAQPPALPECSEAQQLQGRSPHRDTSSSHCLSDAYTRLTSSTSCRLTGCLWTECSNPPAYRGEVEARGRYVPRLMIQREVLNTGLEPRPVLHPLPHPASP